MAAKVKHVATRLASPRAIGDDRALVVDILARDPRPGALAVWRTALGTPSPSPAEGEQRFPEDWVRVWSWAAVIPDTVLTAWQGPLAQVSSRCGQPDPSAFDGSRTSAIDFSFAGSPYSAAQLSALPALEAAELVAGWRPDRAAGGAFVGPVELARALATTVGNDPVQWSVDPSAIVMALGELLYVEHYFRALHGKVAEIVQHAPALLVACAQARELAAGGASPAATCGATASERTEFEHIARAWLDEHVDVLFRDPDRGADMVELTVQWAEPTDWLYANLGSELFQAVRQGTGDQSGWSWWPCCTRWPATTSTP